MVDWNLSPATDIDIHFWSYGTVTDIPSLYNPRTFGPPRDDRCECGKYNGAEYRGMLCDRCGVKIFADASAARHQRLGSLRLACFCRHPVTAVLLECFPIAPVAFRTTVATTPNPLGQKYERLVTLNQSAAAKLPPPDAIEEYYPACREFDTTALVAALHDILNGAADEPSGSLLTLIVHGVTSNSLYLSSLLRSYGYASTFTGRA